MPPSAERPVFFASPTAFRRWLEKHHDKSPVLWVGYFKRATGKPGITYHESLDQALCFGWIDGVRKRIDEHRYMIRFSPRTAKSVWSHVNLKRFAELKRAGFVTAAGAGAFERRDAARSEVYSYENRPTKLAPDLERQLRANKKASAFFDTQPPGYRRIATWWVMSAKQDATRLRRLTLLIQASASGSRFGGLVSPSTKTK